MILRYLLKTVVVGLVFERDNTCDQYAIGFVDSNCIGDWDKWRSTTGYVITLLGALVSWKFTLQSTIVLSTIEVEYMTLIEAVKETIWLEGLLDELRVGHKQIFIYSDSQSVICLVKNPLFLVRMKHIDVRYQFVQEIISDG